MPTKDELEIQIATLQSQVEQSKKEMEALKAQVVSTARRYGENHNWCEVVDNALRELDLIEDRSVQFTLTKTWVIDASLVDSNALTDDPTTETVEEYIRSSLRDMYEEPSMDSDWSDVTVSRGEIEITIEDIDL